MQRAVPVSSNPLISRERAQKVELLNHLVANLAHTIVICGPEGVGKSRLLKRFQETTTEPWIFCWLKGDNTLNMDRIQELLGESIAQYMPDLKSLPLANSFDRLATRNNKIVLVLDDAGSLAPGLIERIISYAERKPVLRIILALTHSEIYLKNGTDPAIDDCYQIDIPPLSEKQCGDFLEYLSTLPSPRIQFSAINESMVATLYRETHGIPGNILANLPAPDDNKKDYSKTILFSAVAGLIALALGVQWWSSRPKTMAPETTAVVTKPRAKLIVQPPTIQPTAQAIQPIVAQSQASTPQAPMALPQQAPVPQTVPPSVPQQAQKPVESKNASPPSVARNDVINDLDNQAAIEEGLRHNDTHLPPPNPAPVAENSSQPVLANTYDNVMPKATETGAVVRQDQIDPSVALDASGQWLSEQPVENYTLQLMALSNEQAVIQVMQSHQQALGQNLRYLKSKTRSGRDRFVLVYGSFTSPEQAKAEAGTLPKELQKTWLRKIGVVQAEINPTIPTDTPD